MMARPAKAAPSPSAITPARMRALEVIAKALLKLPIERMLAEAEAAAVGTSARGMTEQQMLHLRRIAFFRLLSAAWIMKQEVARIDAECTSGATQSREGPQP